MEKNTIIQITTISATIGVSIFYHNILQITLKSYWISTTMYFNLNITVLTNVSDGVNKNNNDDNNNRNNNSKIHGNILFSCPKKQLYNLIMK